MKDTTFKLRLDQKQLDRWKKEYKRFDFENLSAFIRHCIEQIIRGKA